ncbi:lactate/malate family dehydrogenase [Campylobacter sp. MIT 97-5078]|uniref:lactate/malate family dehydrogenase n=1 Tax=Campylobacter sp. MIT 97-5078 TaxID=1548153 RepID=UPI000513644A|nr:lactate dehydrogenase [Campylobacter sp. MIT 97-5078]KGI56676.1 lactate dehydrogenase [Campylobacter sp. MIT 97-5078]TQR27112.1 L-lactate dehydrogenase [Campylobacter sp. MIT 97-5078]
MQTKVGIVGVGFVGAATASNLVNMAMCDELMLYDIKTDLAVAHVHDLKDSLVFTHSHTKIYLAKDIQELAKCQVIVLSFRKIHLNTLATRLEELENNTFELINIILPLEKAGFKGVYVIATNPNDSIVYLTASLSKLEKGRIFGSGTNLDSSRLRRILGEKLGLNPCNIKAFMIGEHGDSQFAYLSHAYVGSKSLSEYYEQKLGKKINTEELEKEVANEGYFIYNKKGCTEYGIGGSCAMLAEAVLKDKKLLVPVSSVFKDYALSLPCIIGKNGVEEVLECEFSEAEKAKLEQTKHSIKTTILSVKDRIEAKIKA